MITRIYKRTRQGPLRMAVFSPSRGGRRPAIVWFSGGGWGYGGLGVYERQCAYLAGRGMVAACAEFRAARPGKPYHAGWAAEDAKSAVRWLRLHAARLGTDPGRVAAAGESSGATMAMQTVVTPGYEAAGEPRWISSRPDALVLYDPAAGETLIGGLFRKRFKMSAEDSRALVPNRGLGPDFPPALLVYSKKDFLLPGLEEFRRIAAKRGYLVTVRTVKAQPHGFMKLSPWQERALGWTDRFLGRLGWLRGRPGIGPPPLTVDWSRPVVAPSLPTVGATAWFRPLYGAFRGLHPAVYQLSFAPRKGGWAAFVALKPGRALSARTRRDLAGRIAGILGRGRPRSDPRRRLAVQFIRFPYGPHATVDGRR